MLLWYFLLASHLQRLRVIQTCLESGCLIYPESYTPSSPTCSRERLRVMHVNVRTPPRSPFHAMLCFFHQIFLSLFMLLSFPLYTGIKAIQKIETVSVVIPLDLQPGLFTRDLTQCEKAVFHSGNNIPLSVSLLLPLCLSLFSTPLFQQRVQSATLCHLRAMLIMFCFYSGWF